MAVPEKIVLRDINKEMIRGEVGNEIVGTREFQIEPGIPVPDRTKFIDRCPFAKMAVGDSFPATLEEGPQVRTAAHIWKFAHPDQNFTIRKIAGSYRCWRTK